MQVGGGLLGERSRRLSAGYCKVVYPKKGRKRMIGVVQRRVMYLRMTA